MRDSKPSSLLMMAAASMAIAGLGPGLTGVLPPHRSGHRPTPPKRSTELHEKLQTTTKQSKPARPRRRPAS